MCMCSTFIACMGSLFLKQDKPYELRVKGMIVTLLHMEWPSSFSFVCIGWEFYKNPTRSNFTNVIIFTYSKCLNRSM
jgi:hypothetical protein